MKLDKSKVNRPHLGEETGEKKSKKGRLQDEAKRQNKYRVGAIVLAILLVIAGFRVFGQGQVYDAICVDQRTMTRAATGVPCEQGTDTNHRWWYTTEAIPNPGDTINEAEGSFREPNGPNDTVNKHVETD